MSAIDLDQPKQEEEQDRFQRYGFSKRIAGVINKLHSDQSLVIGLYGKWGEGKTSVMNFIKKELDAEAIVINFNPWMFSDQDSLLKAFFASIAKAMEASASTKWEELGELLSDYGSAIGTVGKLFGVSLEGFKQIGDKLKSVTLEKLRQRVDNIIRESGKRIVVFIDDIDRLDSKEIEYIFKMVKLVADFPASIYVLAFDDLLVSDVLKSAYGNHFLEKIIQLPLRVPKATVPMLHQYTNDLLEKVFKELQLNIPASDFARFRTTFDENFSKVITNPRLPVRYANAVYFAVPLLAGEVNISDLLLLEALNVFFPEAHSFVRNNGTLFLTDLSIRYDKPKSNAPGKDEITAQVSNFFKKFYPDDEKQIREIWIALFPQFSTLTRNIHYGEDAWKDWHWQKRVCSGKYFERYFTYAVLKGEISDILFDQFINDLEGLTNQEGLARMKQLFDKVPAQSVMFKFRLAEDRLEPGRSERLAAMITLFGRELPDGDSLFSMFTPRGDAASLIAQMIINQPAQKRASQALLVMSLANNLRFELGIAQALLYKDQKNDHEYLTDEDEIQIKDYLIARFKFFYNGHNFFQLLEDLDLQFLMTWWNKTDEDDLTSILTKEIQKGAIEAIALIKVFTPTVTRFGKPVQTFKAGFNQKQYDLLCSFIDPRLIYLEIKADGTYPVTNIALNRVSTDIPYSDAELAGIFMQFYEQGLEQGNV